MEIIPAIDLRGGKVVRLLRGEYDKETVYTDRADDIARQWQAGGAKTIHIVDLDGAKDGAITNREAIKSITTSVDCRTELGGGLREMTSIEFALETLGVSRVILGSVLLEKPELAAEAAERFPNQVVLGIDARDGMMSTRGWRENSTVKATDLVREFESLAIAAVIYTDIARDGTLEGPNLTALEEMAGASPFPVIASGGIGELAHIQSLAERVKSIGGEKVIGVIVGKALYEKKFTVAQAIETANLA